MGNSTLFVQSLNKLCEIENSHPSFPVKGITAALEKGANKGSQQIILKQVHSLVCLPYHKLRDLLELGINRRRELLDSLPVDLGFSIDQIIDGCAQALRFESERARFAEMIDVARTEYRDSHLLVKNHEKGEERARGRAVAALVLDPSILNATRQNVGHDASIPIQLHTYGCAYYHQDRLQSSKQPGIEVLLAFNLAYIFRHWPLSEATFPTYPPRKQPRGQQLETNNGKPRLDIVAHFVNALFPPADSTYSSEQIKNLLNKMNAAGAIFRGW